MFTVEGCISDLNLFWVLHVVSRERESVVTYVPGPGTLPDVHCSVCAFSRCDEFQVTRQQISGGKLAVQHLLFHK